MLRFLALLYGIVSYVMFLATFMYWLGFLSNLFVPKGIDSEPTAPLALALAINTLLILIFGLQHSIMARPFFKAKWTRYVPRPIERSTYVLISNLCVLAIFYFWQPVGGTIWQVENPTGQLVLRGLFLAGAGLTVFSTFLINHFDLLGLRQVWLYFRGQRYTPLKFGVPGVYKYVRHPLYVGWFMTLWITPHMTAAHLFFAVAFTGYVLIAIRFEERDLMAHFGPIYADYRDSVPMLIPKVTKA